MGEKADDDKTGDQGAGSGTDGGAADDENLLDDEAKNGGGDDGGKGDDDKTGDEGKGGDDDKAPLTKADLPGLIKSMTDAAVDAANRVADKRINQVLDKKGAAGGSDDGKGGDDKGAAQGASGPDAAQVRGARLAFRDYIDTEMGGYLGNEERAFVNDLGKATITGLAEIDDEDQVGRQVAASVAQQVKGLRKFYEQRTKAALKRKGLLKDSDKGGQAEQSGAGGVGPKTELDRGAAKAAEMFGARGGADAKK